MIVVFGSLNIDLSFAVDRLPRPGETVLCPGYVVAPGGKGLNQAVAAARAGAATAMFGCVGGDAFGASLRALLAAEGIAGDGIATGDGPTACATIAIDRAGENAIVVGSGANREARAATVPDRVLGPRTTLVLQNEVPLDETLAMARRARACGTRVVFNVAPAGVLPEDALAAIDVLVVNEIEAAALAAAGSENPAAAARILAGRVGGTTIVTLGGAGALAIDRGQALRIDALPVRPVDTVGAGDAFVGALAARLDAGDSLAGALRWASVAGGLACLTSGAVPSMPARGAIEARLADLPPARPA